MTEARPLLAIRIPRPWATEEEFLAYESETISRTGILLLGTHSRPQGTILRFELTLSTGAVLVRGEGRVVSYNEEAFRGEPGLLLKFTRLDPKSKLFVDRIAAQRQSPASQAPPPDVSTMSVAIPAAPMSVPMSMSGAVMSPRSPHDEVESTIVARTSDFGIAPPQGAPPRTPTQPPSAPPPPVRQSVPPPLPARARSIPPPLPAAARSSSRPSAPPTGSSPSVRPPPPSFRPPASVRPPPPPSVRPPPVQNVQSVPSAEPAPSVQPVQTAQVASPAPAAAPSLAPPAPPTTPSMPPPLPPAATQAQRKSVPPAIRPLAGTPAPAHVAPREAAYSRTRAIQAPPNREDLLARLRMRAKDLPEETRQKILAGKQPSA